MQLQKTNKTDKIHTYFYMFQFSKKYSFGYIKVNIYNCSVQFAKSSMIHLSKNHALVISFDSGQSCHKKVMIQHGHL